jgi:hypothetical protein|tara:strand:+ start:111 stop:446 length:336 start_codon:yes stop_codon:yes gene_type:complete
MANIQKFRAHESLNIESAGDWQVQSAVTADADGVAVDVTSYHQIHLLTDKDIYFTFNTTGTDSDINTSNDLYLKGGDTIYTLKVPRGLGNAVHLIMERKESSDATVRIILA